MTEDYIFDVDGTLMNVELRVARAKLAKRPEDKVMNWDLFLDPECMLEWDRPNYDVCKIAEVLYDAGEKVIITSARNERHRKVRIQQLAHAGVGYNKLYLRKDDDFRPDDIVKEELYWQITKDGFNPVTAFDDRKQVVDMWRKIGLNCYQVRRGDF